MTKYRDMLVERENLDIGSVVGCGLDRLERDVSEYEIDIAIQFYKAYKEQIRQYAINERRKIIAEYVEKREIPDYLRAVQPTTY